ncbi:MAG: histidinol-phosphate transaminase [Pseudomonadota bacterium]
MTVQPHPVIRPQPGILDIAPYVGGQSAIPGANRVIKLSSNENPHGPSPRAEAAFAQAAGKLASYPDSSHDRLRRAIADVHGLDAERVLCGNGSDECLALLAQAYAGPGDEVIHTEHGFGLYRINAQMVGATPVRVAERDLTTDADAILAACTERTRLVYVANPNNPTGTMLGRAELTRLAEGLPPQALLVLDGAYAEYVRETDYDAGLSLVEARDDVVMTRTFSKIHGLAALRIGWLYGPAHVVDALGRFRPPFNLNTPALLAGEAAMRDVEHVERCAVLNEVWRDWLAKRLGEPGVPTTPSQANFLLADFGSAERAEAADAHLKSRGLIVRRTASYGLPGHLRITVGDEAACRAVAEAVAGFAEGA